MGQKRLFLWFAMEDGLFTKGAKAVNPKKEVDLELTP